MSAWKPIESAPRDKRILGYSKAAEILGEVFRLSGGWVYRNPENAMLFAVAPTHWMPLPAPPEQEEAP